MTRTPEQRLSDADKRKWYAPTPFEQIHECGAKVNPDAARQALEDVNSRGGNSRKGGRHDSRRA